MSKDTIDYRGSMDTRKLTVIAQDPSFVRSGKVLTTRVTVPAESLEPGPSGARIQVIDYDTRTGTLYKPRHTKLDTDPYDDVTDRDQLVNDPDFHAQNVYALVMATLYRFEKALGRLVSWSFNRNAHQIKIAPHAFADANAFYSRADQGLMFGYFQHRKKWVFTCLSHDVVVHEATHALLDGIRPFYDRPSSPDQAAFHEGFADIVALLSVFQQPEVVNYALGRDAKGTRGMLAAKDLKKGKLMKTLLFGLAKQMGASLEPFHNRALRESLELEPLDGDYTSYPNYHEPHALGEVLVAAVMHTFLAVWIERIQPIIGAHSSLADRNRVVEEGVTAAEHLLRIVIRTMDYLPPTDILFPDFLSALITADIEICPDDSRYHYREKLLSNFASYGITPASIKGPAEMAQWNYPEQTTRYGFSHFEQMQSSKEAINRFVWENRKALKMHEDAFTRVISVRPVIRTGPDGFVLRETVAEIIQTLEVRASELKRLGIKKPADMPNSQKFKLYGGNTLVFDEYGLLKYDIGTGVTSKSRQSKRIESLWQRGELYGARAGQSFASLHRARALRQTRSMPEEW